MWSISYKEGAIPGKKRKTSSTHEEQHLKRQTYEKEKRPDRTYQSKWAKDHPWLTYEEDAGMKCLWCIEVGAAETSTEGRANKNTFLTGCKNYKTSTIIDHEKTKGHLLAAERHKAKTDKELEKTPAYKSIIALKEQTRAIMALKFRNMHAIIKHNRPFTDYIWLNDLDKMKGLNTGETNTYNNHQSAAMLAEYIADVERTRIVKVIKESKFFSLTMDGSTDDSVIEQETLFVRTCCKGELHTHFLCIGEPDSTSSIDLYNFVQKKIEEIGIKEDCDNHKLVGFGSDGASNMLGKKSGLGKLLQKDHPELITIHCLAHRLELAFKDVFKTEQTYDKLATLLIGCFYFYKNSPKQRKSLKETFKVMNTKCCLPHRVGGSRWMPHLKKALNSILTGYRVYNTHLSNESHSNAKAEGLACLLQNYNIIMFAVVLQDLLVPLVRLSLFLQRTDLTLADVQVMMESTVDRLEQYRISDKKNLKEIQESSKFMDFPLKVKGRTRGDADADGLGKQVDNLVSNIIEQIKSRFSDVENNHLYRSTVIAGLNNWPSELTEDFGVEEVQTLTLMFKNTLLQQNISVDEIAEEWSFLKTLVYKRSQGSIPGTKNWREVNAAVADFGVKNILALIDLVRSLPPTSILNEASFNQMKLIKSDRRHRLSNKHLDDCMIVRLESPSVVEYDPNEAIDKWMITPAGQKRRPTYSRGSQQTLVTDSTEAQGEPSEMSESAQSDSPFPISVSDTDSDSSDSESDDCDFALNAVLLKKYSAELTE